MNSEPGEPAQSTGTLRGIGDRLLQLITTRVELLCFELAEERRITTDLLLRLAIGTALALVGVMLLTAAVILVMAPAWRPLGAAVAGLAYAGAAVWLFVRIRRVLEDRPPPFSATVDELKRDREWLKTLK